MNKALFILFSILGLNTLTVQAQKVGDNLEKLAKDPKTIENAAKADVYRIDNKRISDKEPSIPTPAVITPVEKKKYKKRNINQ